MVVGMGVLFGMLLIVPCPYPTTHIKAATDKELITVVVELTHPARNLGVIAVAVD